MTEDRESPEPRSASAPPPTYDEVVRIPAAAEPGRPAAGPLATAPLAAGPQGAARPIRIGDVARQAGVSPITVSRVLRSPAMVSPLLRDRVRAVVEQTGYVSNPHAAALRSGRSTIVVAFVSNLLSQQYNDAASACGEVLDAAGYQLMIWQTSYSYARETAAVQALRAVKPAGLFFTGAVELEQNRRTLREFDIPIVESWAYPRDPIDMLVGLSNTDAGRMAADHLFERGRRRFAFVGRSGGRGRLRLDGFQARAQELGAGVVLVREVGNVRSSADGHRMLRELNETRTAIDAVFFANDLLAIGALLEARHLGIAVPDDLAVLSIGDSEFAAQMTPSLSVIAFDGDAVGRRAGQLLADRLAGAPRTPTIEHVPLRVIARQST